MNPTTHVIQIGVDGRIVIHMPEMAGQYMLVQQGDGRLILSPYDLRSQAPGRSIAKIGSRLHVIEKGGEYPVA